jgi:hypothetical protein
VRIVTLLYIVGVSSRANYHRRGALMSRVRFVDHRGKRIILLDFAGIVDAFKQMTAANRPIVRRRPS